ncbi:MAG: hypothetical protein DSZ04_06245 [Sulfurimonas sp.]|nr:MAG: hypothetical protein DSZ04_06245 [Sulfurimonas sp.]
MLASGKAEVKGESTSLEVAIDIVWIVQTVFMSKKTKTTSFEKSLNVIRNTLHYFVTTMVDIYENTLSRVKKEEKAL